MAGALVDAYHRTLAGRVTAVEMHPDERAAAVAACPWEWSTTIRGFTPWPADRVRGAEVIPPSLADEARPIASSLWDRT